MTEQPPVKPEPSVKFDPSVGSAMAKQDPTVAEPVSNRAELAWGPAESFSDPVEPAVSTSPPPPPPGTQANPSAVLTQPAVAPLASELPTEMPRHTTLDSRPAQIKASDLAGESTAPPAEPAVTALEEGATLAGRSASHHSPVAEAAQPEVGEAAGGVGTTENNEQVKVRGQMAQMGHPMAQGGGQMAQGGHQISTAERQPSNPAVDAPALRRAKDEGKPLF